MADKTIGEKLKEELFLKKENGLKNISDEKWEKAIDFCEGYKAFLSKAKTEREAVKVSVEIAEKAGIPIVFAALDFKKKEVILGDQFIPTGDADADMIQIKAYYKDINPKFPEKFGI